MSPELAFLLTLTLRMAITAAFVITASIITERSGPVIGALVATPPISAGPSYVFLALDHDAAFIAPGALASLPINGATMFLGLTYVLLAQRHNVIVSLGAAVLVWFALALLVRQFEWTLLGGIAANVVGLRHLPAADGAVSPCEDAAHHPALVRHPAARRARRNVGCHRGDAVLDHRPDRQRHSRTLSRGLHQPDADPASADRWPAHRRRDRQWRLGPDGFRHRGGRDACHAPASARWSP